VAYFLAILAALIGGGIGFLLAAAAAGVLAPMLGISSFEGAAGYFAVLLGGPIGAVIGLVLGPLLVLRRAGHRRFGELLPRVALAICGALAVAAAGLGGFWTMRPLVNPNGPAPQLVFEIRLPPSVAAPISAIDSPVELQTSRNRMPATMQPGRREGDRDVLAGRVELYYRTWERTLVLTMPDKNDVLFDISLGLTPEASKSFGPWQRAEFIAQPGRGQAQPATAADRYEIRYRVEWADDQQ
jgi:hypothetical protein